MAEKRDLLVGMKEIAGHLGLREKMVRKIMQEDPAFPARKAGFWLSSRRALDDWAYEAARRVK